MTKGCKNKQKMMRWKMMMMRRRRSLSSLSVEILLHHQPDSTLLSTTHFVQGPSVGGTQSYSNHPNILPTHREDMNDPAAKDDLKAAEKEEEAKLRAKYPQVAKPGPGFLQKRLQKGQKYFDSGDYNMAKADVRKGRLPASALSHPPPPAPAPPVSPVGDRPGATGETIPTPECMPGRKSSIHVPSKLVTEAS